MTLLFYGCASFNSDHSKSIKEVIDLNKCNKPCWLEIEQGMALEVDEVEKILGSYYGEQNVVLNTGGLIQRMVSKVLFGELIPSPIISLYNMVALPLMKMDG